MKQSWFASWFETLANTATGFGISLCLQWAVCWWYDLPLHWHDNLAIIGLFTIASLLRGIAWRRLMEALHVRVPLSPFMLAVIAERRRQIEHEGWSLDHDDKHPDGEMARAGGCYLFSGAGVRLNKDGIEKFWPWSKYWWKPRYGDRRRDLVRGCALGIAEGEKFDRCRNKATTKTKPLPVRSLVTDDSHNDHSRLIELGRGAP